MSNLCPTCRRPLRGAPKLTDAQRKDIRKQYYQAGAKQTDLAKQFSVSQTTIARVVGGG